MNTDGAAISVKVLQKEFRVDIKEADLQEHIYAS